MQMSWWPEISESLQKPWPRGAVLCDLRWWADHERRGTGKRPGRVVLMHRWGWSERKTRAAMADLSDWAVVRHGCSCGPGRVEVVIPEDDTFLRRTGCAACNRWDSPVTIRPIR